jgi:glutamine amidotransferase
MPTLGICLGMQLLFDESEEGEGTGLGIIPGRVRKLRSSRLPQIGWNSVSSNDAMFDDAELKMAYYANSFVCEPVDRSVAIATSEHDGEVFVAAVRSGETVGVQFHPEKSSMAGVRFVHAFVDRVRNICADARRSR